MSNAIKPAYFAEALQKELDNYSREVAERVNEAGANSIKKLRRLTKATAPVASGSYKKNIAIAERTNALGVKTFTWYVKKPDHRLTHLLVHGHATRNGGRTKANPFLQNALAKVLPEYEESVKEALKK